MNTNKSVNIQSLMYPEPDSESLANLLQQLQQCTSMYDSKTNKREVSSKTSRLSHEIVYENYS